MCRCTALRQRHRHRHERVRAQHTSVRSRPARRSIPQFPALPVPSGATNSTAPAPRRTDPVCRRQCQCQCRNKRYRSSCSLHAIAANRCRKNTNTSAGGERFEWRLRATRSNSDHRSSDHRSIEARRSARRGVAQQRLCDCVPYIKCEE